MDEQTKEKIKVLREEMAKYQRRVEEIKNKKYKHTHQTQGMRTGCAYCESLWYYVCQTLEQSVHCSHQFGSVAFWSVFDLTTRGQRRPVQLLTPEMRRYEPKCLKTFARFEDIAIKSNRKMRKHGKRRKQTRKTSL
jgi:hypothetical protein